MFKDVLKIHKYRFPESIHFEGILIDIKGQKYINYLEAIDRIEEYKLKYGSVNNNADNYSDVRSTSLSVQRD